MVPILREIGTTDFPPEAGQPLAEKSQIHFIGCMNLDELLPTVGVYVLLGSGSTYVYKGSARNLRKRVTDHMQGRVARTRKRRPLLLVHFEYTNDYTEARRRENWLKSGQGRKWLKEKYAWVAEWQTQRTSRRRRVRLWRKNHKYTLSVA